MIMAVKRSLRTVYIIPMIIVPSNTHYFQMFNNVLEKKVTYIVLLVVKMQNLQI